MDELESALAGVSRLETTRAALAAEQAKRKKLLFASLAVPLAACVLGAFVDTGAVWWVWGLVGLLVPVAVGFWWRAPFGEWSKAYRAEVLPEVAQAVGGLVHRTTWVPDVDRWADLGVVPSHTGCTPSDHFSQPDDGRFEIGSLRLTRTTTTGKTTTTTTVFRGFVAQVRLMGERYADVGVLVKEDSDPLSRTLGGWFSDLVHVPVDDPRFEGRFDVWTTDVALAEDLLTPRFMAALTKVSAGYPTVGFRAAVLDGQLILALPTSGDPFEAPPLNRPLDGSAGLAELTARLHDVVGVAREVTASVDGV